MGMRWGRKVGLVCGELDGEVWWWVWLVGKQRGVRKAGLGKRGGEWVVLFMLGGGRVLCGCSWLYST
jgi:hypothetical protein